MIVVYGAFYMAYKGLFIIPTTKRALKWIFKFLSGEKLIHNIPWIIIHETVSNKVKLKII